MVAVLESGEQVLVGPGVAITAPSAGDTGTESAG
jgi:predicted RecA/RadA family phage recombinase